jgi:hypothetical protein
VSFVIRRPRTAIRPASSARRGSPPHSLAMRRSHPHAIDLASGKFVALPGGR